MPDDSDHPLTPYNASPADSKRLKSIDFLRGVAILWVLGIHMPNDAPGGFRENPWFFASFIMKLGNYGVPLFILLSGFCIHRKAALQKKCRGQFKISWISFWKRRFWRLYPAYIAAIAFGLFVPILFGVPEEAFWTYKHQTSDVTYDLLTHLSMTHNLTQEYAVGLANGVYWSLGLEEQLYGLYFFALLIIARFRFLPIVSLCLVLAIAWQFALPLLSPIPIVPGLSLGAYHMWPIAYWLHWVLGALAVSACVGNVKLPAAFASVFCWTALLSITILLDGKTLSLIGGRQGGQLQSLSSALNSFAPLGGVGGVLLALAFFSLILWAVKNENNWVMQNLLSRGVVAIGQVSYSVYLTHIPCMKILNQYTEFSDSGSSWLLRSMIYLTTSLLVGTCFYFLIEQRFLHSAKAAKNSPKPEAPTSVPAGPGPAH